MLQREPRRAGAGCFQDFTTAVSSESSASAYYVSDDKLQTSYNRFYSYFEIWAYSLYNPSKTPYQTTVVN